MPLLYVKNNSFVIPMLVKHPGAQLHCLEKQTCQNANTGQNRGFKA